MMGRFPKKRRRIGTHNILYLCAKRRRRRDMSRVFSLITNWQARGPQAAAPDMVRIFTHSLKTRDDETMASTTAMTTVWVLCFLSVYTKWVNECFHCVVFSYRLIRYLGCSSKLQNQMVLFCRRKWNVIKTAWFVQSKCWFVLSKHWNISSTNEYQPRVGNKLMTACVWYVRSVLTLHIIIIGVGGFIWRLVGRLSQNVTWFVVCSLWSICVFVICVGNK